MKRTKTVLMGDVLKEFFDRPYVARRIAEGSIPEVWRSVVGDHIADMTTELRFERGILHVRVESSLIRQELFYQREALKEQINRCSRVAIIGAIIVR